MQVLDLFTSTTAQVIRRFSEEQGYLSLKRELLERFPYCNAELSDAATVVNPDGKMFNSFQQNAVIGRVEDGDTARFIVYRLTGERLFETSAPVNTV